MLVIAWASQNVHCNAGHERRCCQGCFGPLPLPPDLVQLAAIAGKAGASQKQVATPQHKRIPVKYYAHYHCVGAARTICKTAGLVLGPPSGMHSPPTTALAFLLLQRLMLSQALDDVCSSPAAFISALAEPDISEGPGSPNSSSPMRSHGFDIERVNQIYRAILQVCGSFKPVDSISSSVCLLPQHWVARSAGRGRFGRLWDSCGP